MLELKSNWWCKIQRRRHGVVTYHTVLGYWPMSSRNLRGGEAR